MPFNLIRATLAVYGRRLEVAAIIISLILVGWVGGYMMRGAQIADIVSSMQLAKQDEIDRLQAANREALRVIADRVELIAQRQEQTAEKQEEVAGKVESAAGAARRAATTADGAAANAARAAIRQRVIPAPAEKPKPENNAEWLGGG
nr:hypothetical protein [Pseudomonas sp.]